ncbi:MAG: 6-phospho-beta-glucosidase, partial [Promicromonosporaceae bacterium]|nr:6-phospho-beta-glucosidase [Promicromonosporaceae bacterium]
YFHDRVLAEQLEPGAQSRAHAVIETENALLKKYADETEEVKPPELENRGGAFYSDSAVDLLASLTADRGDTQVVNIANDGVFPFLPDDHVIEVPATIGAGGISTALSPARNPVAPDMAGLISHVAGYERLALEAAVKGGRERVVRALLAHPLVGQWDKATRLADDLIAINKDYLPWAK